ncbi:endonuclease domain-containing 1 protein-like [Amblyraja radiata]|uniref:endonuclease domain-containing 1 protein-like n=1 Tax=Amblyraja radiata TaxID=386614 RepID=UPI001403500B|nr:endonuclease domain-containing 1 protein-like [Amblyraja radiata]
MKLTLCILPMGFSDPVWFLLLAIAYPGTVQGKVVDNFQPCQQFFKDRIAPQGFENEENKDSMVKICQMYKNITYFATLYRTDLRIPVYSAYIYTNSIPAINPCRPCWFCEPQIENRSAGQNMQECKCKSGEKQALNSDYQGSGYQRGHLYPFSFNHQESATASCTLTNAVPQEKAANVKWYHYTEKVVKGLTQTCHNSGRRMYLVTGSDDYNHGTIKNRVKIPGLVWTAACCTVPRNQNDRFLAEEVKANRNPQTTNGAFSIAFMGTLFPELKFVNVSVSTLERRLNASIFNECKEASREIYEEVQRLLRHKVRDNKKRNRVGKCSLAACQRRPK